MSGVRCLPAAMYKQTSSLTTRSPRRYAQCQWHSRLLPITSPILPLLCLSAGRRLQLGRRPPLALPSNARENELFSIPPFRLLVRHSASHHCPPGGRRLHFTQPHHLVLEMMHRASIRNMKGRSPFKWKCRKGWMVGTEAGMLNLHVPTYRKPYRCYNNGPLVTQHLHHILAE